MAFSRIQFTENDPKPDPERLLMKFKQTIVSAWYHNATMVGKCITALDYYLDYMECDFHNRRLCAKRLGNLHHLPKPVAVGYVLMDCRKLAGGREKIHAVAHSGPDVVTPATSDKSLHAFYIASKQALLDLYVNKRKNAYVILITLLLIGDDVYYTVKTVIDGDIVTLTNT